MTTLQIKLKHANAFRVRFPLQRDAYMAVVLILRGRGAAGGRHGGRAVGRVLLRGAGLIYAILRWGVGGTSSGCGRVLLHKKQVYKLIF